MKTVLVLCAAGTCWGFSFGVGAPLASLWLKDAGCNATVIGLNTAIYYLGIAVTAGMVPGMMRRSARFCLITGMIVSGMAVAIFPWGELLPGWFFIRFLNGIAAAMSIIPMETLINHHTAPAHRARNFGYYAFSMALGIGLGMLAGGEMYAVMPRLAFFLGGVAVLPGIVALLGWMTWPVIGAEPHGGPACLRLPGNFLSFGSAWSQGFLEGAMVALLPVYLLAIGLNEAGIGGLMSGIMMGVILVQVPVAWLADRLGRTVVLLVCYGVTIAALAALYLGMNFLGVALCLVLAGACSSAFYPLGLALLGERVPTVALARANAWYLSINCLGSLIGPVLAGASMDRLGKQALFLAGEAALLLVLSAWVGPRLYGAVGRWAIRVRPSALTDRRDAA
jgi:MFS family permease